MEFRKVHKRAVGGNLAKARISGRAAAAINRRARANSTDAMPMCARCCARVASLRADIMHAKVLSKDGMRLGKLRGPTRKTVHGIW